MQKHFYRVLDKYFITFSDAKIYDIKKIKSLIETIKNFSNNIIKSMNAVKKTNNSYTPEDLYFSA